ncbi:type II toxin-antitoxin system HicB family antitoxin [Pseudomonas sp. 1D4]|uniref:type II toxin-antitoxin system HicB family antitoxin n=1 Tax=Pseudomonas sp. 1D4 TaxID=1843691 RepID=UPI0009F17779|nr:type II toxin-antitoxin system HicB family antitoxin [Pseudomonas sp. 1D4]
MLYPIALCPGDKRHAWGVTVPDVPGCFSAGETATKALENAKEALALHFEGLLADGEPIPLAKDVEAHIANPEYSGDVWAVIDFDLTPYQGKAVRINAILPENLLLKIDERVKVDHRYTSRSNFLATAALRELSAV